MIVDPIYQEYLNNTQTQENTRWTIDINEYLCFKEQIFISDVGDL